MTSLQQKKVQTSKGMMTPPTFANLVKMTTVGKSNEKGSWSGASFELIGLVTDPHLYQVAKEFYKTVISGEAKADYAKADAQTAHADNAVGTPTEAEGF